MRGAKREKTNRGSQVQQSKRKMKKKTEKREKKEPRQASCGEGTEGRSQEKKTLNGKAERERANNRHLPTPTLP